MPPDPSKIIFVSQIALNLTLPEKHTLKKCQNLVLKVLNILASHGHIFKQEYLRSFPGLTSLHLVNIQPNSKLHLPTKSSGSALACGQWESLDKILGDYGSNQLTVCGLCHA